MSQKLAVLFRADRHNGELWITAVFPSLIGTYDPATFTIYQHVGQHGSASFSWYRRTRPATPEEYAPLLAELQRIYAPEYDLQVRHKITRWHDQMRQAQARGLVRQTSV